MTTAAPSPAWQPLTFGGVASFAGATVARLWITQLFVSLLVAGSVIWFLRIGWFPVITKAIDALPEQAAIQSRRLVWPGPPPAVPLAENSFLSIRVNPEPPALGGPTADVQLVLEGAGFKVASLLGFAEISYPAGWTLSLSRADVRAWWDARHLFLSVAAGLATIIALLLSWLILAFLYGLPVRMLAFYLDRDVTGGGCWRLAGAALLPGAIIMSGAILLYGSGRLDVLGVLFAWLLHIIVGWVYVLYAPTRLPRLAAAATRGNPFRTNKTRT